VSIGLTIGEAHDLFRDYVDDPDSTFITTAQVQRYLEFGLDQWRQIVRETNPHVYGTICEFTTRTAVDSSYPAQVDGVKPRRNALDLGNNLLRSSMTAGAQKAIMGANAVANWYGSDGGPKVLVTPPIDTILDVYSYNPDSKMRVDRMRQLSGAKAQELSMFSWTYFLEGNVLSFNGTPPTNMIVEYMPVAKYRMEYIDPSTGLKNLARIEDNLLPQFHELVILLAAKRYMIRDQNINQMLLTELAAQASAMSEYLTETQLLGSNDSVTVTMSF
jgi:hypothetical protein